MNVLAALPTIVAPTASDLAGFRPELVMTATFVVLLLADIVIPARRRDWLTAVTVLGLATALVVSIWGWFDTPMPASVYFGSFVSDRLGVFIDVILLGTAILAVLMSSGYLKRRDLHYGEYYSLIVAATTGMMLLVGATSLIVVFLAIELLSIALYIMSGFARKEERSQEAAVKYLLLGGFASAFLLYGMALVFGETGHTQFGPIVAAIHSAVGGPADPLLLVGIVLIFVGFAFKIGAVPFHFWVPDVYQGAPTPVVAFMSVATKVAAFGALIRLFTFVFADVHAEWSGIVALVAILSMVVGNVAALTQKSVKRMLAYSGIAQAGYILIGVVVTGSAGTVGVLYYLATYAFANLGALTVITVLAAKGDDLDSYTGLRGLAFRRPYVAAAMALFLLSLGGFPPTAGFFGKFFVFASAISAQQTLLALWGIATSAIAVFYYLRVVLLLYTRPRDDAPEYPWSPVTAASGLVLAITAAGTVVLGIAVALVLDAAILAQQGVVSG